MTDENYALILGEQDEIRVNINVSNTEDSAYETQLFIVHQKSVSYIAAIKTVRVFIYRVLTFAFKAFESN